jgi:hypothetical protein
MSGWSLVAQIWPRDKPVITTGIRLATAISLPRAVRARKQPPQTAEFSIRSRVKTAFMFARGTLTTSLVTPRSPQTPRMLSKQACGMNPLSNVRASTRKPMSTRR